MELVTLGVRPSQRPQAISRAALRRPTFAIVVSVTACAITTAALGWNLAWTSGNTNANRVWQQRLDLVTAERDQATTEIERERAALGQETADHQRDLATAQRAAEAFATAERRIAQAEQRVAEIAGERAQSVDAQVQLQLLVASNADTARRALRCVLSDPASASTRCQAELDKTSAALGDPVPR